MNNPKSGASSGSSSSPGSAGSSSSGGGSSGGSSTGGGGGGGGTVTYRAVGTGNTVGNAFSVDVNMPAGTQVNDVLVATILHATNSASITAPGGWTLVDNIAPGASMMQMAIYYRVADGTEGASVTWVFSNNTGSATGTIRSYSGVDTTDPIDVEDGACSQTGTIFAVTPDVTTTVANTYLVMSFSKSAGTTWNCPAGSTSRSNFGAMAPSHVTCDEAQAAAGATGVKQAQSISTSDDCGHILALKP